MQTELHHLQTLHIMAEVFRRGMREEVQLDPEALERVFPCLDQLLLTHHGFFAAMKERRHGSARPHGRGNYLIRRIGDVLLQQVSRSHDPPAASVLTRGGRRESLGVFSLFSGSFQVRTTRK